MRTVTAVRCHAMPICCAEPADGPVTGYLWYPIEGEIIEID